MEQSNRREGRSLTKFCRPDNVILSRGERNIEDSFKMALQFLSCLQSALLSTGFDKIILKVKQVTCLENIYLKRDLVAVLPTGYGKSLVFQVLPRLLKERDAKSTVDTVGPSVVLVVSPLNALMWDQISKLTVKGIQAAVLGVTAIRDEEGESNFTSQWEGTRNLIMEGGYEIVFCHPEAFLSCKDG